MDSLLLPKEQHTFAGFPKLSEEELFFRREVVFLLLAGIFLGSLAMLNILGATRFLEFSVSIPWTDITFSIPPVAVGVLPYPITFLCTDLVSELYGKRRANWLVWIGFVVNIWVFVIIFLGGYFDGTEPEGIFTGIRKAAFASIAASMFAYLAAQLVDVRLFHFWKRITGGKHLWLRNNASTMVSQLVDTTVVMLILHYWVGLLPMDKGLPEFPQVLTFIGATYIFKLVIALLDTGPFYVATKYLGQWLRIRSVEVEGS